jgi:hypothetical protein
MKIVFWLISFIALVSCKDIPKLGFAVELPEEYIDKYFTEETFGYIQKLDAGVVIGTVDLSSKRASLVQQLNKRNIPVFLWILLPHEEGYWMNMDNADNSTKRYNEIKSWIGQYNLSVLGLGFDLEADWRNLQEINESKWVLLLESVVSRFKLDALNYAKKVYEGLANQIKSDGYQVQTYTMPLIYDERKIGSTLLERLTGFVDVQNVDTEAPMLYTTLFPYGLGVLQSYGNISSTVSVGITGGIGSQGGGIYSNFSQFETDLLFAYHNLGASYIGIYSLEGCIDNGYLPQLLTMDWTKQVTPQQLKWFQEEATIVEENRQSIQALLYASTQPFDAWSWAKAHPIQVFEHIYEFLTSWYDWRNNDYPN